MTATMPTLDNSGVCRAVLRNGHFRRNPGELEAVVLRHYAADLTSTEIGRRAGLPTSSVVVTLRRLKLTWRPPRNPRHGGDRRSAAFWDRRGR